MSTYTLERLVEDAAKKHGAGLKARGPPGKKPEALLLEVWATLDKYISACLEERRGVALPNFCKIGWQVNRSRQPAVCRPCFHLADAFCRTYRVTSARSLAPQPGSELCPVEELNLSKAAIRYSGSLTKDIVSAGLRILVQQLGDAVSQGRLLKLDFSFGKLLAKERELSLAFKPELLASFNVEAPGGNAAEEARRGSDMFGRKISFDGGSELQMKGHPASCSTDVPSGRASQHIMSSLGQQSAGEAAYDDMPPLSPRSVRASELRQRSPRQSRALEHKLHEQISALERRASEAWQKSAEVDAYAYRGMSQEEREKEWRQAALRENRAYLSEQIKAKERRRRSELDDTQSHAVGSERPLWEYDVNSYRRDMLTSDELAGEAAKDPSGGVSVVGASMASAPASTAAERRLSVARQKEALLVQEARSAHRAQQDRVRAELDAQVQAKRRQQEAIRQFEQRLDANMIEAHLNEATVRRQYEEAARANEREELIAAWGEEAKIKSIRREIEALETGRRVPVAKAARTPAAPKPEKLPGASPRYSVGGLSAQPASARGELLSVGGRRISRETYSGGAPCSARGEALGAVASLALQQPPAAVEVA